MCTDINSSKDVELWIDIIARASWQETENAPVEMSASILLTLWEQTQVTYKDTSVNI